MNRCDVFDYLEDECGLKPENLTEREKAIIGLVTGNTTKSEIRYLQKYKSQDDWNKKAVRNIIDNESTTT